MPPPAPAPAVSRRVEAGGLELHYLDYGTEGARPMLCVHGGAAHAHWFDFVAAGFSGDWHVRSIDQRGHGDSDWADPPEYTYDRYAADIAEAVERLDLRDFVLVGHSMGGTVSLTYAARYPGRLARLVVIDSSLRMTPERVKTLHGIGSRKGSDYGSREEFVARYKLRPGNSSAPRPVVEHLAARGTRAFDDGRWRPKFDRRVYGMRDPFDAMPHWAAVRIPALVVRGALSDRITDGIYGEIRALCPQAELAEVADAEHHVPLDNPTGFVAAVRGFLDRHPL